ncbi:hypothetical protein RUND412_003833 [Rhizina undulata]
MEVFSFPNIARAQAAVFFWRALLSRTTIDDFRDNNGTSHLVKRNGNTVNSFHLSSRQFDGNTTPGGAPGSSQLQPDIDNSNPPQTSTSSPASSASSPIPNVNIVVFIVIIIFGTVALTVIITTTWCICRRRKRKRARDRQTPRPRSVTSATRLSRQADDDLELTPLESEYPQQLLDERDIPRPDSTTLPNQVSPAHDPGMAGSLHLEEILYRLKDGSFSGSDRAKSRSGHRRLGSEDGSDSSVKSEMVASSSQAILSPWALGLPVDMVERTSMTSTSAGTSTPLLSSPVLPMIPPRAIVDHDTRRPGSAASAPTISGVVEPFASPIRQVATADEDQGKFPVRNSESSSVGSRSASNSRRKLQKPKPAGNSNETIEAQEMSRITPPPPSLARAVDTVRTSAGSLGNMVSWWDSDSSDDGIRLGRRRTKKKRKK